MASSPSPADGGLPVGLAQRGVGTEASFSWGPKVRRTLTAPAAPRKRSGGPRHGWCDHDSCVHPGEEDPGTEGPAER